MNDTVIPRKILDNNQNKKNILLILDNIILDRAMTKYTSMSETFVIRTNNGRLAPIIHSSLSRILT